MKDIPCHYCGHRISASKITAHLRDTGDVTDVPDGACPELFVRRSTPTCRPVRDGAVLSGRVMTPI